MTASAKKNTPLPLTDPFRCVLAFPSTKSGWRNEGQREEFESTERVITRRNDGTRDLAVADLDGDGDLDVVSVGEKESLVAWYENLGPDNDHRFKVRPGLVLVGSQCRWPPCLEEGRRGSVCVLSRPVVVVESPSVRKGVHESPCNTVHTCVSITNNTCSPPPFPLFPNTTQTNQKYSTGEPRRTCPACPQL